MLYHFCPFCFRKINPARFLTYSFLKGMALVSSAPLEASAAVLKPSEAVPESSISVQGPQFDKSYNLQDFLASYQRIGFQATSLSKAIEIVDQMVRCPFHRQ